MSRPRSTRKSPQALADPKLVFVDSSAWLAFFSQSDRNHEQADVAFRRALAARTRLLTTNLVLAEVHRLLLFRAGIRPAAAALDKVTGSQAVRIQFADANDHGKARRWLQKLDDQQISLTDAVSFAVMETARCRVALSFDRDFWIAGFELWRPV